MRIYVPFFSCVALVFVQGCTTYEKRFEILSAQAKYIPPTYFVDSPKIWSDVGNNWKREHDLLGFEVLTEEKVNFGNAPHEPGSPEVALVINDCSGKVGLIYSPGVRFVGRTSSGKFEYEAVMEYRRQIEKSDRTYYDLFETSTELCFHIQTIEYLFSRGDTYRLRLNSEIKGIAEGR